MAPAAAAALAAGTPELLRALGKAGGGGGGGGGDAAWAARLQTLLVKHVARCAALSDAGAPACKPARFKEGL